MDKRLKIFLSVAGIAVLALGIFAGKEYWESKQLPEVYTVATEANEKGENFSANVHVREEFLPADREGFSYDKKTAYAPIYAMEFFYEGLECGILNYTTRLEEDVMMIDQVQEKNCDEPQKYFITSLLVSYENFSKIRVNQWIGEEVVNFYEFEVDPAQDIWPVDADLVVEQ